jgi:hypothetical protein
MGKRHRRIRALSATGQVAGAATEKPGLQHAHRPRTGLPSLRSPRKPPFRSADRKVKTGRQLPGRFSSPEQRARCHGAGSLSQCAKTSRHSVAASGCSTELVQPPRSSDGTEARTRRSATSCNSYAIRSAASEDSAEKRTSTETCSVASSSSGCSSSSRIACTRGSSVRVARTNDRIASGDSPSSGIDSMLV